MATLIYMDELTIEDWFFSHNPEIICKIFDFVTGIRKLFKELHKLNGYPIQRAIK